MGVAFSDARREPSRAGNLGDDVAKLCIEVSPEAGGLFLLDALNPRDSSDDARDDASDKEGKRRAACVG